MTNPQESHPLAPEAETLEERAENTTEAVEVRGAVEVSSMRFVLGIGIVVAIIGFIAAWQFGMLAAG